MDFNDIYIFFKGDRHRVKMRSSLLKSISVSLMLIFFLGSCGFHLKTTNGLTDKYPQIYLQTSDPLGELARQMRARLRGAGIEIIEFPDDKISVLTIKAEQRSERTISLNLRATNAEKEIGFKVHYSLSTPGYRTQHFNINLYRDFLESSSQALAKSREEELLTRELRITAADHIISTMLVLKNEPLPVEQ